MTLQVLVATMHQKDHSLLERMNIQCDAIVINQCDRDEIERFQFRGHDILWMSLKERGVGLSRNTALMRATADILLFADDDIVYNDGYAEQVIQNFNNRSDMDMLIFRLESTNPARPTKKEKNSHRLHWYNGLKYGAFRIAIRKDAIRQANVFYSLLFGGGAKYQSGEDSLFIQQCLRKGLRGYVLQETIGIVKQEETTWFKGHNEKYFYDKGVLMKQCFGIWAKPLLVVLLAKNKRQTQELGLKNALEMAFKGVKSI